MAAVDDERQVTVILADDHNVIRAGLRSMLEGESDLRVIGEADDAASAAKLTRDRRPDVLVLDLQMPGAEPARDIDDLREKAPSTAIVILTMHSDARRARDLLRAGAAGYVLKQAAERNLTEAIRTAAGGGSYIDPELGAAMARLEADPLDDLSERERELLQLLALGHTNREIGEQLFLSVRAIEVNRAKLLRDSASSRARTWSGSRSTTASSSPPEPAASPEPCRDSRPASGLGADLDLAAQQLDPLAHPDQAAAARDRARVESAAVVVDGDLTCMVDQPGGDVGAGRRGVLDTLLSASCTRR